MIFHRAALTEKLFGAHSDFRILPAGVFRSRDGRPAGLPGWKLDAASAQEIIHEANRRDDTVIDYEHQTLNARTNGLPAPAAGWFKQLEWREGFGLFALNVQWTDKARTMIAAGEYRYISPVFEFNAVTGAVTQLIALGITNNPGLVNLTDLSSLSINSLQNGAVKPRDSDRSIERFNRSFGELGVFHPDTPRKTVAALTGQQAKPEQAKPVISKNLERADPDGVAHLRRAFPGVFAD